jgi:hypothetical protein
VNEEDSATVGRVGEARAVDVAVGAAVEVGGAEGDARVVVGLELGDGHGEERWVAGEGLVVERVDFQRRLLWGVRWHALREEDVVVKAYGHHQMVWGMREGSCISLLVWEDYSVPSMRTTIVGWVAE